MTSRGAPSWKGSRRTRNCQPPLKFYHPRFQPLVLGPGALGHGFDRLEFFALHHVEIAQHAFGAVAKNAFGLALEALCGASGVGHDFGEIIKKSIVGLGRRAVEAELAGPRATAGLLAVLPLGGLLLAAGLGADPVHQLLHTPLGAACAVLGVGLDLLGLAWTARLVRRAGKD